jgi:hypothetical protein
MAKQEYILFQNYFLRKKNRRIEVSCYVSKGNNRDFSFIINTKRLIDFKTRHILESNTIYGLESMLVLKDILMLMLSEPLFLKIAHVEINKCKTDRYSGGKWVNEDLLNSEQSVQVSDTTDDDSSTKAGKQK